MSNTERALSIDALRGIALFGILAVNIQSFVGGIYGPTLGQLNLFSSLADTATVFVTALLLEYKFYPVFCFCFGYGFAVQARKLNLKGHDARAHFASRLNIMFLFGVIHGVFLYFGDILTRYAITGYLLRRHLVKGAGPRHMLRAIRFWFWVAVTVTVISALLSIGASADDFNGADAWLRETAMQTVNSNRTIYTSAGFWEITQQRFQDYWQITLFFVFNLPQIMLLFLVGAFVAQMGWLRNPEKHRAIWKKILIAALLIGIPLNIFYAFNAIETASNPGMGQGAAMVLVSAAIPVLAFAYIAATALIATTATGRRVLAIFATPGKIALTIYLSESALMGALLLGYGFKLGDSLTQFQLFGIAVGLYAVLVIASHIYPRYFRQGPMEVLWRHLSKRI